MPHIEMTVLECFEKVILVKCQRLYSKRERKKALLVQYKNKEYENIYSNYFQLFSCLAIGFCIVMCATITIVMLKCTRNIKNCWRN